jgi:hypothetical protein
MFASLRALLEGVVDYAGLFPPAQLSLDQSIRNYARYRQEAESWMLGRFICPAVRLSELVPYGEELFQSGPLLTLSVLGRGASDPLELFDELLKDISDIAAFEQRLVGRSAVDAIELRLAAELNFLSRYRLQHQVQNWKMRGLTPYCETVWGEDWRASVNRMIASLSSTHVFELEGLLLPGQKCGFKLRAGGLHASSFPTVEQVAFTIVACRDEGVPLKFTAGLHHPIRHFNDSVQTHMHGFVNVFAAGVLARARRLSEEQVGAIIADEDPRSFYFDDAELRWKDYHATTAEVIAARREVVSFGSCSFDEPREDLRKLGWFD